MVRLQNSQIRTLDLIAAGHTYREIAALQAISLAAVSMQVKRIRWKIGIAPHSHLDLLRWMAANGWEIAEDRLTRS